MRKPMRQGSSHDGRWSRLSLAGAGILAAVLVLAGQSESLTRVWANHQSRAEHASANAQTRTPLRFDTPISLDVPIGETQDFYFVLGRDAFVGMALVTDNGRCLTSMVDDMSVGDLVDTMPAGIGRAQTWRSPQMAQVFLDAGVHTLSVEHPWSAEWPCKGVLYVYSLGLPEGKDANRVAIGGTYYQTITAGNVNLHNFQVTNAPQSVVIYVIPGRFSGLKPVVRLYGPDGLPIAAGAYDPATGDTRLSGMMLASNGDYTVTVQDWGHAKGGSYQLAIANGAALVSKVGQVRWEYLPAWGPHEWTLIVEPRDVVGGEVDCIAYGLVEDGSCPYLDGALPPWPSYCFSRTKIASQPGSHKVSVLNLGFQAEGAYLFGCANVGDPSLDSVGAGEGGAMIGIGGEFGYWGDGFTRFLPAFAGSSASFSLETENNRIMDLELWYGRQRIESARGRRPAFRATFARDGVYTLVGKAAPGTKAESVSQTVSIKWVRKPAVPTVQLPPVAVSTPTMAPTAPPAQGRVFGPSSGSLPHEPKDGSIEVYSADVSLTDFVAEATFYNPYPSTQGDWDYGFLFRQPRVGATHAIRVESDGDWKHHVQIDGEWTLIENGTVSALRTGADRSNHLRVIAIGDSGAFYVNDKLVASLDMSGLTVAGDIQAATGIGSGDEIEGGVTHFEDFTVWSLDVPVFGPSNGSLPHEPEDTSIEVYSADVSLTDFVAEATFYNPYSSTQGDWDYGFLYRRFRSGTLHAIRVESDGDWKHSVVIDGDWTLIENGTVSALRTGADRSNHLRVIAIGDSGAFYVNDQLVASLDMSGLTVAGDIQAATGIGSGDEIEGQFTRFEHFTVWSLD